MQRFLAVQENLSDYSYSWNITAGIGVNDASLAQPRILFEQSGEYTLSVTVSDGCGNSEMASVDYGASVGFAVTLDSTDESGNGLNDGMVVAEVSGGLPPYTFSWSNGTVNSQSEPRDSISSLGGGAYNLVVTDALGCTVEGATNVLTGIFGAGLDLTRFSIYPNPNNGQFQLELSLRTASSLQVGLINGTGQQVWAKTYRETLQIQEEIDAENLPAGVYVLRIQGTQGGLSRKVIIH